MEIKTRFPKNIFSNWQSMTEQQPKTQNHGRYLNNNCKYWCLHDYGNCNPIYCKQCYNWASRLLSVMGLDGSEFTNPRDFFKSPLLTKIMEKRNAAVFYMLEKRGLSLVLKKWFNKNVWLRQCYISTITDAVYIAYIFFAKNAQMDQLQLHRSRKPAQQSTSSGSSKSLTFYSGIRLVILITKFQ